MNLTHYGNECLSGGTSTFELQLGGGADVFLHSIDGVLTAAAVNPGFWDTRVRDALVQLTYSGPAVLAFTKQVSGGKFNNEVDNSAIFAVNFKIVGGSHQIVPVHLRFEPALRIKGGKFVFRSESLPENDWLNTETHLTLQWE